MPNASHESKESNESTEPTQPTESTQSSLPNEIVPAAAPAASSQPEVKDTAIVPLEIPTRFVLTPRGESLPESLVYCPITCSDLVMRHPVICSDQMYYELQLLIDWFTRRGNTVGVYGREILSSAIYDVKLKTFLDNAFGEVNRFPDYDPTSLLQQLQAFLAPLNPAHLQRLQVAQQAQAIRVQETAIRLNNVARHSIFSFANFRTRVADNLDKLFLLLLAMYYVADNFVIYDDEFTDQCKAYSSVSVTYSVLATLFICVLPIFDSDFVNDICEAFSRFNPLSGRYGNPDDFEEKALVNGDIPQGGFGFGQG